MKNSQLFAEKMSIKEKTKRNKSLVIAGLISSILYLIGILVTVGILAVKMNQNCLGHLKRAADASSIETADQELSIAIEYLEKEGLTKGYTSIFWQTPDEDIEFWYKNIKSAKEEIESLPKNSSPLEKSTMLIKLRETLLDHGDKGSESITCPDGLSRYPNNILFLVLFLSSFGLIFFFTRKAIISSDIF